MDKKEHEWSRDIRKMYNARGKRRVNHSLDFRRQKAIPERVKTNRANIPRIVHIELCQKFGFVVEVKLYNSKPET